MPAAPAMRCDHGPKTGILSDASDLRSHPGLAVKGKARLCQLALDPSLTNVDLFSEDRTQQELYLFEASLVIVLNRLAGTCPHPPCEVGSIHVGRLC